MQIVRPEEIDYDCRTAEEAVRKHEQEEFLKEVFRPKPSPGAIFVRWLLLWNPFYRPVNR